MRHRDALYERVQSNFLDERLGDCAAQDAPTTWRVVEQVRAFELRLQVVQRYRQLVGDSRARFRALQPLVLAPNTRELRRGVFRNLSLDVFDVALIKLARLSIFEKHKVHVFFRGQRETSKDFKRGASHATCAKHYSDRGYPKTKFTDPYLRSNP